MADKARECVSTDPRTYRYSTTHAMFWPVSVLGIMMLASSSSAVSLLSSSSSSVAAGEGSVRYHISPFHRHQQIKDNAISLTDFGDQEWVSVGEPPNMPQPSHALGRRQPSRDQSPSLEGSSSSTTAPLIPKLDTAITRVLQTEQQCTLAMAIRDSDRDDQLSQDEFVNFINQLFSNKYASSTFDTLPCELQQTFSESADSGTDTIDVQGTKPGQTPTAEQEATISALCTKIISIVDSNPASGPCAGPSPSVSPVAAAPAGNQDCTSTVQGSQCNTALAIADLSRDDQLDETEFVRLVNGLSSNAYSGSSFEQLPGNIQSTFNQFAVTNGQIDVTGSKPGQTPTQAQADFISSLCCETKSAIDNPDEGGGATEPPAISPSPPTASPPPTYLPQLCRTAMASSDFNRDDGLNEDEYVRFLDRLAQNQYQGMAFSTLSEQLQANFADKAQGGVINIVGSKPGQTASTAQSEFLDAFCTDTAVAIQADDSVRPQPSASPAGNGSPTLSPQDDQGQVPTFSDSLCLTAMATSDYSRDSYLDHEEYVRFLNRLTQSQFADETFETLEDPLTQTYENLADDSGQIPIIGAVPGQDATTEQEASLLNICSEVAAALDQISGDTSPPAKAPSTGPAGSPPPTFPPGQAEVYSSFIILNNAGLTAQDLATGLDREGLNDAYVIFAENAVATISNNQRLLSQSLRGGRRLVVTFRTGSAVIYLLLDDDCPEGLTMETNTFCQTVFAKYVVEIDTEDPQKVSDDYSEATQQMITNGDLQKVLEEKDPRNEVSVVKASSPLKSTFPPTAAPETPSPNASLPNDDAAGAVGAIVGGVFAGIAVCAFIGWATTKFGKQGGAKGLDDDDKLGGGDDDASDGEKENGFGFGRNKDDSGEGEDNPFDVRPEQAQDTKNVFGFGKKNKQNNDDNAFGLDAAPVTAKFGDGDENLELFAFDEPSVTRENGGGDEGSLAEKKNSFGLTETGWGNTDNGGSSGFFGNGGSGWASGDNGGTDSFFGGAGFGNEQPKESDGSGSESASEEGSYTSSEDSTYESGNPDEEGEDGEERSGSYSRSSADEEGSSYGSGSMSSRLRRKSENMDGMIDDGNWDGIAAAANSFRGSSIEGSSNRSSVKNESVANGSNVDEDEDSFSGSESGSASASATESSATTRTEDREMRAEYRAQVDALVRLVLPDEVEKVDAMMEQFKGREAELVSTLQTMQERSATQRARAAVHKSKNRPQRGDEGAFSMSSALAGGAEGAAAGTAAIAAASLPIPAEPFFEDSKGGFGDDPDNNDGFGDDQGFGNEDAFGTPTSEAFNDEEVEEEGSYYEEEVSRSSSGSGSRSGSRSYYSNEGSQSGSRSYYSEEGSQVDGGSKGGRSFYSNEGSQVSGSQRSPSQRSGSYSGSRSRSQYSGEGSRSRSRSRSQHSGEASRSHYSGEEQEEGSRSQSGSRSHYSDEEGSQAGSRSHYSDEEGSQEGSRSYYSGEEGEEGEEGSQEGSRSYYSGDEGSQSQGSRSHSSNDDGGDEVRSFGD